MNNYEDVFRAIILHHVCSFSTSIYHHAGCCFRSQFWSEKFMKIEPNGYFIQGIWVKGISPTLIGKKIIRIKPCMCEGVHKDYSFCLHGLYGERPEEWVKLIGILDNKCLVVNWGPNGVMVLEEWWNDGNWIEWNP